MADKLDEIKARLKAATKGPWDAHSGMVRCQKETTMDGGGFSITTSRYPVAECFHLGPEHPVKPETAEANAALIAHAPADLQWAIDTIEELRREIQKLRYEGKQDTKSNYRGAW